MNKIIKSYRVISIIMFLLIIAGIASGQKIDDKEIKQNIISIENPLQRLVQLEPKNFEYDRSKYKALQLPAGRQYGFMVENLQTVFPELVTYKNYSYSIGKNLFRTATIKHVDVESIIPVLVASIKEQQAEIEKLKSELALLKDKNATAAE
ncbi:MAG: tail fiber domain-containing protein [Chitinophagaceae bacterium]